MQNRCIFIDADDTLWENERDFRAAEAEFARILAPYAKLEDVQNLLWEKQEGNIPHFGYGSKTYFIGMLDAALELCGGSLSREIYDSVKDIITRLCFHPLEILPGVEETLDRLSGTYRLILATKGENKEQLIKFRKSGLEKYFFAAEVMMDKSPEDYLSVAGRYGIAARDIVMVGNSVRSDILPVIAIGGTAIHIPHESVWVHEIAELPVSDRLHCIDSFADLPSILAVIIAPDE